MNEVVRIAVDIGGTFTDIALVSGGSLITRKVPSTVDDYADGMIAGITALLAESGLRPEAVDAVLHGCTVASNTILEGNGARTALVTTRGFRDVLELRRVRVPRLYDPGYVKPPPLVPRELRLEIDERVAADGAVVRPLRSEAVRELVDTLRSHRVEAVAVTYLHSYRRPEHEHRTGEILRAACPDLFVTLSVEVLPEIREYERTSTTVINAYVGPPVRRYVSSLASRLDQAGLRARLLMMQSNGGIINAESVLDRPAQIIECGPAAGVIGAARLAARKGIGNILTFDMGGTTAKASIIENGHIARTGEYEVGGGINVTSRLVSGAGYALKLPVIDISEVGAGGGSIVWRDNAGALKVGPRSAGASPGPACYRTGGKFATVTDANVVLGYVNPTAIAGGTVRIDAARASQVLEEQVARPLGMDLFEAAYGVHAIANSNMIRAVKAVSTHRGRDAREFALFAFGGNGGVHAASMARELDIGLIIVPTAAGVFSSLGLLLADVEADASQGMVTSLGSADPSMLAEAYAALEAKVTAHLSRLPDQLELTRLADLRFAGQAFELTIALPEGPLARAQLQELGEAFELEHERTYGHRFGGSDPVEIVCLRVVGRVPDEEGLAAHPGPAASDRRGSESQSRRLVHFGPSWGRIETSVCGRRQLGDTATPGPLIVEDGEAVTVVPPDFTVRTDEIGNLELAWNDRRAK